jgi:hypothetical protein
VRKYQGTERPRRAGGGLIKAPSHATVPIAFSSQTAKTAGRRRAVENADEDCHVPKHQDPA